MPRVDVTLDDEIYSKLKRLAEKRGLSLSSMVRSLITEELSHSDPFDRVQQMASKRGVYWINFMRQLLNERLEEMEGEERE